MKMWLKERYPVLVGFLIELIAGLVYGYASMLYGDKNRVTKNVIIFAVIAAVIGCIGLVVLIVYEYKRMRNRRVRDLSED